MNPLARLDPGDPVLLVAATSLVIATLAAVGSEGLARACRAPRGDTTSISPRSSSSCSAR